MAGKILTVIPLLVLSGLFFAAGIVEGGVLFLVFAAVVAWAFVRRGVAPPPLSEEEASEIATRSRLPGGGGVGGGGGDRRPD
jgi:hypothetical protein